MTFNNWLVAKGLNMPFYYSLTEGARRNLVDKYFTDLYGGDPHDL